MDSKQKPTLWQVILSALAAMFGVQSQKNRERDFQHGNPLVFIVIGFVLLAVFVLCIYGVVKLVLH